MIQRFNYSLHQGVRRSIAASQPKLPNTTLPIYGLWPELVYHRLHAFLLHATLLPVHICVTQSKDPSLVYFLYLHKHSPGLTAGFGQTSRLFVKPSVVAKTSDTVLRWES